MSKTIGQIRQGDILLVPVLGVTPPNIKPFTGAVVLAEGEMTGHAHRLSSYNGIITWDDMVWIVGDDPGTLQHEDHDPEAAAVVPPGVAFRVVRQREFSLGEQWVAVRD